MTISARPLRYAAVGAVCVAINNALLVGLDAAGIHYAVSVAISAAVMIPLGFALQAQFTFTAPATRAAFGRYAAVMIVNAPLAWLVLWVVHDRGALPMVYAAPVMTGLLFIWNYLASGWAITSRSATSRSAQGRPRSRNA